MYLCVLCGSEKKQRLFPYTALTDKFLKPRRSVYCAVRTEYYLDVFAFVLSIHLYPSACYYFQTVTRAKPVNCPKSSVLSENGDQVIEFWFFLLTEFIPLYYNYETINYKFPLTQLLYCIL